MPGIEFGWIDGSYLSQGEQPLPLWLPHQRKTLFDQGAVFACQRCHVHHGADGHQVEPLIGVDCGIRLNLEPCLRKLKCQTNTCKLLVGVGVGCLVGIDDRICLWEFIARLVVVRNDHVQTQFFGSLNFA